MQRAPACSFSSLGIPFTNAVTLSPSLRKKGRQKTSDIRSGACFCAYYMGARARVLCHSFIKMTPFKQPARSHSPRDADASPCT